MAEEEKVTMAARLLLDETVRLLKVCGITSGQGMSRKGEYCLAGALSVAAYGHPHSWMSVGGYDTPALSAPDRIRPQEYQCLKAAKALARVLGVRQTRLWRWNDDKLGRFWFPKRRTIREIEAAVVKAKAQL